MYLLRAKKHFETKDEEELQKKRENFKQRQKKARQIQAGGKTSSILFNSSDPHKTITDLDELPDGSCFAHKHMAAEGDDAQLRQAGYIGTFSVQNSNPTERTEFVHKQLQQMRKSKFHKKVIISISVSGVKVFSSDGTNLLMAHALRRISYASCDPEYHQFSFLAREPQGKVNVQFCHAFVTPTPQLSEELNSLLGNAFKIALLDKKEEEKPSFNEVIKKQLDDQKATFREYQVKAQNTLQKNLKTISTPTPFSEKAMEHMERRRCSRNSEDFTVKMPQNHRFSLVQKQSPGRSPFRSIRNLDEHVANELKNRKKPLVTANVNNHNSNIMRGSPVMALKDSIDREFESRPQIDVVVVSNPQDIAKYRESPNPTVEHQYSNSPVADTYLTPVCSHALTHEQCTQAHTDGGEPGDSISQKMSSSFLANRPLPAIPMDSERPLRIPNQLRDSVDGSTGSQPRETRHKPLDKQHVVLRRTSAGTGSSSGGHNRQSFGGLPTLAAKYHNAVTRTQSADDTSQLVALRASSQEKELEKPREKPPNDVIEPDKSVIDKQTCDANRFAGAKPVHASRKSSIDKQQNTDAKEKTDAKVNPDARQKHSSGNLDKPVSTDQHLSGKLDNPISSLSGKPDNPISSFQRLSGKPDNPISTFQHSSSQLGNPVSSFQHLSGQPINPLSPVQHYNFSNNIGTGQFDNVGTGQFDNIDPIVDMFDPDSCVIGSPPQCIDDNRPNSSYSSSDNFNESYESTPDDVNSPRKHKTTSNNLDKITVTNTVQISPNPSPCVQLRRNIPAETETESETNPDDINGNYEESTDDEPNYPFDVSNYQIADPPQYSFDDFDSYPDYPDSYHTPSGRPKSFPILDLHLKRMVTSVSSVDAIVTPSRRPSKYQNESDSDGADSGYEVPLSPGRLDSLRKLDRSYIEDDSLRRCSWYQPGIPREIALEILQEEEMGGFIIRDSTTHPGCFALSVNVPKYNNPSGIAHYLILRTAQGVTLKGLNKDWPSLTALVTHHTVMPEMLPCTLRLPRDVHNPAFAPTEDVPTRNEDPDYQIPSNIQCLMASIDVS